METARKKISVKNIILLQTVIVIYTLSTVAAKYASGSQGMTKNFLLFLGLDVFLLGIYAILWQQMIKKIDLSVAYINRAMAIGWSMIWAVLIFKEQITINNILGVIIVAIGTMIVNSEES